jgi:hypothetical protein
MLVLKSEDESLQFFIHPKWQTIVHEEDLAYIEALLQDLLDRAKMYPGDLFKQLTSLGVGPLTTQEVGFILDDHPFLLELLSKFVEL